MWGPICIKSIDAFGVLGEPQFCLSSIMILVYASLAAIDLLVATVAGIQVSYSFEFGVFFWVNCW